MSTHVTRWTRARTDGTEISCPCGQRVVVHHFAWVALVCTGCDGEIEKTDWTVTS